MRVLVFGGRDYWKKGKVFRTLDDVHRETPVTKLIEGGATGADRCGRYWAQSKGVQIETYEADWDDMQAEIVVPRKNKFGKWYNAAAGNLRNVKMLKESEPDMAIEFPGGPGTADMHRLVQKEIERRGLRFLRIEE
jgi:hypothetical protein